MHAHRGMTSRTSLALYLANVKPVRDARYRQLPEGLFHTFGNVSEVTESLLSLSYRVDDDGRSEREAWATLKAVTAPTSLDGY